MTLFGVGAETPIETPSGPIPAGRLAPGDQVWAWDVATQRRVARAVVRVDAGVVTTWYTLASATARIDVATPGLLVWDEFEGMFRGAGSLSALTELRVWGLDALVTEPLDDAVEHTGAPVSVVAPVLEGAEGTWFAGRALIRHAGAT